jgi:hypothetical protein
MLGLQVSVPTGREAAMRVAFADHLLKAHKPSQTAGDVNQAAAAIVRESTQDR